MPPAPDAPALVVDDVSKSFAIPRERVHTLKETALHPFRRTQFDVLHALRGVSFAVERGEFFGVVGRNGSGKSTLLKCMAGIYAVDAGRVFVSGQMSTFIELGVGFNPDLPARENVMINGTMLGLSPREARRRFDSVIDFAELREFTEVKLKNYSSGMMVRLAFSVMIQVDADVLLIDEVLAVGDAAFAQKCFEEFERIKRSRTAVILVTHDMGAVERFCDRAMLLEHGRCVQLGAPHGVGMRYLQLNFSESARAAEADRGGAPVPAAEPASGPSVPDRLQADVTHPETPSEPSEPERLGDGTAEIVDAWFEDADGNRSDVLESGRRAVFVLHARFAAEVHDPNFGFVLENSRRNTVVATNTGLSDPHTGTFRAGDEVTLRFGFHNILAPDRYTATPAIAHHGSGLKWIDWRRRLLSVVVSATTNTGAILNLPVTIEAERDIEMVREEASA